MKTPDELLAKITVRYSWDDLDLPQEKQKQLIEVVNQLKPPKLLFRWFGLTRSIRAEKKALLVLSEVTCRDKTIAAQFLANKLRLELYR